MPLLPVAMFFGAAVVGPVVATTLLTWTSSAALYVVMAAIGVACLPLTAMHRTPRVAT